MCVEECSCKNAAVPLDQVDIDEQENDSMSFLEHIDVLRKHLFRSVVAVFIAALLAFINTRILFDVLIFGPKRTDFWSYRKLCDLSNYLYADDRLCLNELSFSVQNITITGQFFQHIMVSIIAGFILAFPFVLWEFWRFIRPALQPSERKYTTGIVFSSSMLFMTGVLFGYFILTPVSVNFLGNYSISEEVSNIISLESYISFVAALTLAAGIIFQLPLFIYFLAKLGIVSTAFLRKYRRHAVIIILVLSALLTPPDVASQVILGIPIYFLYEAGIILTRRIEKRQALKNH